MPTKDDFSSDQVLPSFLLERTGKSDIGNDLAVSPSRVIKVTILMTSALALGVAAFSVGNPKALVADLTASVGDKSAFPPGIYQSTSTTQTSASAQATSSTTKDQPSGGEIAATDVAAEDQAKTIDAPTEALFRQFQAWAAENDAQAPETAQPFKMPPYSLSKRPRHSLPRTSHRRRRQAKAGRLCGS